MSFKKKLATKVLQYPGIEIFFGDESRFGTRSKIGYGWYQEGSRTPVKVKLGYESFYLYGATNPVTGKSFKLILPNVDTDCMNVFLKELAEYLDNKKVILIIDGAGWHKSKNLRVPNNIILMFLPPYSPELNPIERL
jgi:hypothetical protein